MMIEEGNRNETGMNFTALKVGESARRTGLTVRTLHHYDALGLVKPSHHTGAGHRLYTAADVARLQQGGCAATKASRYAIRPPPPSTSSGSHKPCMSRISLPTWSRSASASLSSTV